MLRTLRLAGLGAAFLIAVPALAQTAPRELRARMEQLARALNDNDGIAILPFFPRNSQLEIVRTPDPGGAAGPVLRRVLEADSIRANLEGESMCVFGGALAGVVARWRYAGGGRFVPRVRDSQIVSVEWGRERGRWVVRRITEEYYIPRRLLGTGIDDVSRDTAAYAWIPEERRSALATEWYRSNQPITVAGRRLVKYGLPRHLSRDELERGGTIGVVPVFFEKGRTYPPEVVYVWTGPDEYQPYQDESDSLEDICGRWW